MNALLNKNLFFFKLNISMGVRFVLDITSHTMGKCSCIDFQITPLTHLWMSSKQNQKLWSCDSKRTLSWNRLKHVGAKVPFFPFAMGALHFFPKKKITKHCTLKFGMDVTFADWSMLDPMFEVESYLKMEAWHVVKNHETLMHVDKGQRNYFDQFDVNLQQKLVKFKNFVYMLQIYFPLQGLPLCFEGKKRMQCH